MYVLLDLDVNKTMSMDNQVLLVESYGKVLMLLFIRMLLKYRSLA